MQAEVWFCGQAAKRSGDVGYTQVSQQAYDEVFERSHDLRGIAGSDLGSILIEGDITDIVEAVFDLPVSSVKFEQVFWAGPVRRQAGDAAGDLLGFLPAGEVSNLSSDAEDLSHAGEIQVII